MPDNLTKEQRSRNMSNIKSKNTKPEITLRKYIFNLGYRYALNNRRLPGTPDIFFKKYNLAVFVHGCFWHQHGCKHSVMPKSNVKYWEEKFVRNKNRDSIVLQKLKERGINHIIVWECEIKDNIKYVSLKIIERFNNVI